MQQRAFLGRLFGPLIKAGLRLMKNVLKPFAKSVLIPLELRAPDAGIHSSFGISTANNISNFQWRIG